MITSHGEDPKVANTTIIYNHGRFASMEHYAPRIRMLHELGFNVFAWDYRGYGKSMPTDTSQSPKPPATSEWMDDSNTAFQIASTLAPDPSKLIVYGMSVGGMPAGEMVFQNPDTCATVFESAYNSITAKIETNLAISLPGGFLTTGLVENDEKLVDTKVPTMIMHGSEDDRIHLNEAETLFEAIPEDTPKEFWLVDGAEHALGGADGGVPEQGLANYGDTMKLFLESSAPTCLTLN